MIQTRRDVDKTAICNGATERLQIKALESLDNSVGFGFPSLNRKKMENDVNAASRLSEQVLHLLLPRSDLGSTAP